MFHRLFSKTVYICQIKNGNLGVPSFSSLPISGKNNKNNNFLKNINHLVSVSNHQGSKAFGRPLDKENTGLSPSLAMEETEPEQYTAKAVALATTLLYNLHL